MRKLLSYLKKYRKDCVIAPAFKMLEAFFDLLVPLVMADMIDVGIPAMDAGYLVRMCLVLVLLGVVGLACSVTAQYFAAKAAVGFSADVRHALFAHILTLSRAQFEEENSATWITRMTSDLNQVQNGVNMVLRLFLRSPFIVFGSLILAFTINVRAALVFAAAIPILFGIVFAIMAFTIPGYRRVQEKLDEVMRKTRENLTGVRIVRAFRREADETASFHIANGALYNAQKQVGRISALMNPLTYVAINLAVALILISGAFSINVGTLTQGDVIALINYMSQVLVELVKLANLIVVLSRSMACARRISAVMEKPAEEDNADGQAISAQGKVAVAFRDAGISYGDGKESLSHVTFTALRGQTIGVIGGTGSGKSSLVNLIPRLYDCSSGLVEVFSRDVRAYNTHQLQKIVGVVPQRTRLFSGTVRSNLCFGKPDATDEELWRALETAQAADFVRAKPLGLDAPVDQNGRNFSGGQRQRLAIARALVPQPSILILDDAASALDYATDAALRRSLQDLPNGPTVFLVSQRVTSLMHADCILVLDDGTIVDSGTHEELLDRCVVYREICQSQFETEGGDAV